jgi:hypothetical protein
MKIIFCIILSSVLLSCGKKTTIKPSANSFVDTFISKKSFSNSKEISDQICIDDVMINDLGDNDNIKKILDDSDISFCNGMRVRIKIFKISNGEVRVYGYAESSTGVKTCLRQDLDYQRVPFVGNQGTLFGEKIKISLGGHGYNAEKKLIKSTHLKGKFVKFDGANFSGEMGFFEKDNLKCWSNH